MPLPTIDLNECEWTCRMITRPQEQHFLDGAVGHQIMEIVTTDAVYEQVNREDNAWIDIRTGDVVQMDHARLRANNA